jgi:hypothetical protein
MKYISELTLGTGHSIMVGHKPSSLTDEDFFNNFFEAANIKESISSYGLFGSDLNYNTYYPGVSKDDFTPKDEEFIEPSYRLLSEVIVSKYWPTDFSQNGVLKKAMNMLIGQTVNCDHETSVGNAIGSIKSVAWQPAYKDETTGLTIPAGINGILKIDAKSNPRIARGIMMDPPSIHSNSVTVRFEWEKSHKDYGDERFFNSLGTYDAKGELVRRVVTNIISFAETSLVSHGADPFAKQLDKKGKIIHSKNATQTYSFSEMTESKNYYFADFKRLSDREVNEDTLHNTMAYINENEPSKNNNNKKESDMDLLEQLFGEGMLTLADGQEKTKEAAIEMIQGLVSSKTSLTQQVTDLTEKLRLAEENQNPEEVTRLNQLIEADKPFVTVGKASIESLRDTTVADYTKLMGDKVDDNMLSVIQEANFDTLKTLSQNYTTQLNDKFPLACKECGSHDVSRGSAKISNEDETGDSKESLSTGEVLNGVRNKKLRTEKVS